MNSIVHLMYKYAVLSAFIPRGTVLRGIMNSMSKGNHPVARRLLSPIRSSLKKNMGASFSSAFRPSAGARLSDEAMLQARSNARGADALQYLLGGTLENPAQRSYITSIPVQRRVVGSGGGYAPGKSLIELDTQMAGSPHVLGHELGHAIDYTRGNVPKVIRDSRVENAVVAPVRDRMREAVRSQNSMTSMSSPPPTILSPGQVTPPSNYSMQRVPGQVPPPTTPLSSPWSKSVNGRGVSSGQVPKPTTPFSSLWSKSVNGMGVGSVRARQLHNLGQKRRWSGVFRRRAVPKKPKELSMNNFTRRFGDGGTASDAIRFLDEVNANRMYYKGMRKALQGNPELFHRFDVQSRSMMDTALATYALRYEDQLRSLLPRLGPRKRKVLETYLNRFEAYKKTVMEPYLTNGRFADSDALSRYFSSQANAAYSRDPRLWDDIYNYAVQQGMPVNPNAWYNRLP